MPLHNLIGLSGVFCILLAYLLLQLERLRAADLAYSLLNLAGSGLILVSLYFEWNLSAAAIEFFWLLISGYGIYKYLRKSAKSV